MKTLSNTLIITPTLLTAAFFVFLGGTIGFYFWYHLSGLFSPPALIVTNPTHDIITTDTSFAILGHTQDTSHVFINGREVAVAEGGTFTMNLALQQGMNIIEVKSVSKFGKETIALRRIVKQ